MGTQRGMYGPIACFCNVWWLDLQSGVTLVSVFSLRTPKPARYEFKDGSEIVSSCFSQFPIIVGDSIISVLFSSIVCHDFQTPITLWNNCMPLLISKSGQVVSYAYMMAPLTHTTSSRWHSGTLSCFLRELVNSLLSSYLPFCSRLDCRTWWVILSSIFYIKPIMISYARYSKI